MAIQLTLGNTPPALGRAQLGEQIRASDQLAMILHAHERWAAAGEVADGLLYEVLSWSTTSTSFVSVGSGGSSWALSRWCPLLRVVEADEGGGWRLVWRAFAKNLRVQIEVLNTSYTLITSTSDDAGASAEWLGGTLAVAAPGEYILRITARRLAFASVGYLHHLAARRRATSASQLPR